MDRGPSVPFGTEPSKEVMPVPTGAERRRDVGRAVDPTRDDIAALFARYREVARRPVLRSARFARAGASSTPTVPGRPLSSGDRR